jgi:hypothetical protein
LNETFWQRYVQEVEADGERLQEALLEQAQAAVDAAAEIVAHAQVLTSAAEELGTGALIGRCAWCGRYRTTDGRWVTVKPQLTIDMADTTHGICEDCVTALRAAGLSK